MELLLRLVLDKFEVVSKNPTKEMMAGGIHGKKLEFSEKERKNITSGLIELLRQKGEDDSEILDDLHYLNEVFDRFMRGESIR